VNSTDVFSFTDGLGIGADTVESDTPRRESLPVEQPEVLAPTRRSVLVSGGSRGIGASVVTRLANDGHRVASLSRSGSGSSASGLSLECDITNTESVQSAARRAATDNGAVEILVANAGVTDDKLMLRMGEESFAHVLDTNLTGTYRLVKAVAGPMLRNRWGRIVFISSVVAMSGSAGQANYAASKAGLIGLARSLAREFGPRGVTCNVIAPGFIETDMTADLGDERRDEVRDSIPLNRMGSAEDVAATVEFLTSDAGGYITGAVIPVDGGLGMGH
jgi:NAD(P)-dependent dehydrogenase (short-subunit alcohol dehydrogenase family)